MLGVESQKPIAKNKNKEMKKVVLIISFMLIALSSCNHEVDFTPRKINYDRDVCHVCKMGMADPKYDVQAINEHGEVRWYDDIGCLAEDMRDQDFNTWKGANYIIWIGNADTGKWIDAEKASYRFGDRTPMGYGYGALKENKEGYFDFKITIKRIDDGKTKRAEFIKKKKMSMSGKDGAMKCGKGKCGK